MTEFRLSGAQWARPALISGLAELAALGAEAEGAAAEAWLSAELKALPSTRRRRRDAAIVALRGEMCALESDNRAAKVLASSLRRPAAANAPPS